MYPAKPCLLIGFHGCDQSTCDLVVSGQTMLKESRNSYDWLGNGIYFWENNYERAFEFASNPPGKKIIKTPAVIGAVIDLQNCLDLLDTEHLQNVKNMYVKYKYYAKEIGFQMPVNKALQHSKDLLIRELDCAVIEYLHKIQTIMNQPPFDSVRGVFIEGDPLYPGAGFNDKNHIQICIRNPNCIKGLFIPRKELNWQDIPAQHLMAS